MNKLQRVFVAFVATTIFSLVTVNAATPLVEKPVKDIIAEDKNVTGDFRDGVLHVSATEAAQLLKERQNINVLDVRTGFEYNRGHIEGAVHINYYSFDFKEKLSALDKDTTWLVHCKSGVRSGKTLPLMKKTGFTSIIHLDGGINSWRDAELPTTRVE